MQNPQCNAFTRADLIACLTGLVLLSTLAAYAVGSSKGRALQLVCANNLRMLGQALHRWAADHNEQHPWWVAHTNGGVRFQPNRWQNNVYYNFAPLSNDLASPKLLACPADSSVKPAKDFSASPDGGFLHLGFQNMSVSYFVGLHALPEHGWTWLSGDRHLTGSRGPMSCTTGVTLARGWQSYDLLPAWTNTVHEWTGNILWNGGQVHQLASRELATNFLIQAQASRYSPTHILSR